MKNAGWMAFTLVPVALLGCTDEATESATVHVEQLELAQNATPYFVRGALGRVDSAQLAAAAKDAPGAQAALAAVLPSITETLGIPGAELRAVSTERDDLGMTHVRMLQHKNGLRVIGGDVVVHLDADGVVRSANGTPRDRELTSVAKLSPEDAIAAAVKGTLDLTSGPKQGLGSELTYLVSNRDGELYLAYEVPVAFRDSDKIQELVYVDALTGDVVDRHPQIFTIKNRVVTNGGGGVFPVAGAPTLGTEASAPVDPVALAAFNNTGITYDCYKALFNRDSYNNLGATLTSQVHVVFPTGVGNQTSPNNAVWSPQDRMMAYGDGDGVNMKQLAYSLDVTSHELTHAVTSSTSNLIYQGESGALNESLSDITGAICEAWKTKTVNANTWLVGDEIWTPNTPGDALRYMASPTLDTVSPDYYPERYQGQEDNGGVHINSGLPNLTFYLVSQGGKHPRNKTTVSNPGIGIEKAGAIFQRALTTKFTQNTTLAQARTLTVAAATELYPGSCAATAVDLAWATVGVGGAAPTDAVPPTVSITAPASGAKVAPGFQVQVTTADDKCINKVELVIDGAVVQTLTAAPFTFTADASVTNGAHTIEVRSYDAFNKATATANVTLSGGSNGGGNGQGGGDGGGDDTEITGGCSTGGSGGAGGLLIGLALLLRRRRS